MVIGPISASDWEYLKLLKDSLSYYYRSKDSFKYTEAIRKEKELLKDTIRHYYLKASIKELLKEAA